ncbi:uncharacterized protein LOC133526460 isoform X2 [Cydia pomonella]|uniref:uncharacterized protein LOC133526460 isoform X2 n=1 Tax=Cydia pomonella TaxID=82600 RepID=UPI002ADD859C|nr:uncharacterized protein LOC133526460 isoform X2 [Cydia pomonella]
MLCLECYICDNCPKAKLNEIQTCGPTTISEPSTTTTESPATITVTTKLSTTSTSTTLKLTTEAISEFTTVPSTISTEALTTSTTEVATTTEARPTSTESTTPTVASSTAALETTKTPMISPADDITSSTDTTITIPGFPSTASQFQQITTPTEAAMTSALLTTATIADATTSSITTSMAHTALNGTVSEPVISTITTKEDPSPTDSTVSFISTLPTTTAVPLATFPGTESILQTFSSLPPLTEQNMESTIQNIPTLSLAQPIATFTSESASKIPNISIGIYPESTVNNIRPDKETNATYSIRRMRSSSEACACKNGEKCDCLGHQRSKRYTLRGLGLSKEAVKYVCYVDKYKINETEIVKRGCAVKEADEKTLCTNLGFGGDCKICDTHQCNGVAIMRVSILLIFSLCFI